MAYFHNNNLELDYFLLHDKQGSETESCVAPCNIYKSNMLSESETLVSFKLSDVFFLCGGLNRQIACESLMLNICDSENRP